MKKICLIVVYFGKLPKHFPIWLETCKYNENVDFIIITDDYTAYRYPKNVRVIYSNLEEIKNKFQKKFNFNISLDMPYKLCDYRPAYGEVFKEYIEGYDFWGHCDIDLFFGDIRRFITEDILDEYDRILTRGHFSLYKNNKEINEKYRNQLVEGCQNYKDVFSTNKSCCYDEWAGHCGNGVSEIFRRLGVKQYDELIYADLSFLDYQFKLSQNKNDNCKNRIIVFEEGRLYSYSNKNGKLIKQEYMYCHFQKRNLNINVEKFDKFCFLPPQEIESYENFEENIKNLRKLTKKKKVYTVPIIFRKKQIENRIKSIISSTK